MSSFHQNRVSPDGRSKYGGAASIRSAYVRLSVRTRMSCHSASHIDGRSRRQPFAPWLLYMICVVQPCSSTNVGDRPASTAVQLVLLQHTSAFGRNADITVRQVNDNVNGDNRPQADVLTYILGGQSYIAASRSERIVRLPIPVGYLINDKDQDSVFNNKLLDGDNDSFAIEIIYFVNAIILILP